jgi:enoyl-CoA hydratase/carnithine racemase
MSAELLRFDVRGTTGFVCLNAPPRNTLNRACFEALHVLWLEEIPRHRLGGIVVHGSGRHFSAGADTEELRVLIASADSRTPSFLQRNIETFCAIEQCTVPVVAAVGGCCLGAGLELALACHYRVAATNATLGVPESTFGLIPGCGGTIRLPSLLGRATAMRMVLSGQSVLAADALEMGLVDLVVDRHELLATAERLIHGTARRIA